MEPQVGGNRTPIISPMWTHFSPTCQCIHADYRQGLTFSSLGCSGAEGTGREEKPLSASACPGGIGPSLGVAVCAGPRPPAGLSLHSPSAL